MSFCRITGRSRGLPRPNYFPLLPPISPADARRFCRITGKAFGLPTHCYIPVVLTTALTSNRIACKVTHSSDLSAHHYEPDYEYGKRKHIILTDYRYVFPRIDESDDQQKYLLSILNSKVVPCEEHNFVYSIKEQKCNLVFSARLEAAVRDGDVRDVMFAKTNDSVLLCMNKGKSVSLDLQDYELGGGDADGGEAMDRHLFEGEGPRYEVLMAREAEQTKRGKAKRNGAVMQRAKTIEKCNGLGDDDAIDSRCGSTKENGELKPQNGEQTTNSEPSPSNGVQKVIVNGTEVTGTIPNQNEIFKIMQNYSKGTVINDDQSVSGLSINIGTDEMPRNVMILGCIVNTAEGDVFVAGRTVTDDATGDSVFEPGMYVHSKNGPTFIPGQIIYTEEEGERFVPGQIIETEFGPRFVPGKIHEVDGDVTFTPAQIVQTDQGPKFIAPDLCDDENGESKYSVQSFLLSPEELNLLKPMHIWTNGGDATVDGAEHHQQQMADNMMKMFNQLLEAGIVVGSSKQCSANQNIDELLQNTINEQIIWKFADSIGCADVKESAGMLKMLFDKIKQLIGVVEQSPRQVFAMAVNALNSNSESMTNGTDGVASECTAVNQAALIDRHLMDIISRTVVDCISQSKATAIAVAAAAANGNNLHANGRQKYTNCPMIYEIISKALAKNLNLYLKNRIIEANAMNSTVASADIESELAAVTVDICLTVLEKLLDTPDKWQQIEKNVTLAVAKCMHANKVDLIRAMINGSVEMNSKQQAERQADTNEMRAAGATTTASASEIQSELSLPPPPSSSTMTSIAHNQAQIAAESELLENICVLLQNDTINELHDTVRHLVRHDPSVMHHIIAELQKQTENFTDEHAIADILRKCVVAAVQKLANDDIKQIVAEPNAAQSEEKLNIYLTDTIQLARALGFTDCILNMSNIMNDSSCGSSSSANSDDGSSTTDSDIIAHQIDQIEANSKTFELLQRVIVMHKLAQNDPEREKALELLRCDPYTARSDLTLRDLLRCSGMCTIQMDDGKKLIDSNDVPISLIYSQNQLAITDFFLRTQTKPRGALLICKDRFQAVVPRESSRDVLTGKCSYTVLDEHGIRHFEPLHMFTALKLQNVTMFEDRFASYFTENGMDGNGGHDSGFDIDIDQILNMSAIAAATANLGFITYKSTLLPKIHQAKDLEIFTKRRSPLTTAGAITATTAHGLIIHDRNHVNYRRSFIL